ncbi:hypothetical protein ACP4OV_018934 [Aristida adscensionis]
MAAPGSEGEPARPWTAASTWAPAGGAAVEDAISFETSDEDAEASPAGVVLSRPEPGPDGESPPCEVTVNFRGMYEIHRVYVRSTARIYEIYHSTNPKDTGKDYLCTVRCGPAVKDSPPSGEESMAQPSGEESMAPWHTSASTSEKREHETKSVSSGSDEDSWVDVKIPESLVGNNTSESQERTVRTCQENTLVHYEATAEMTDVSPCVSLTVRLLSLHSKASVHIEEIYIFADPAESTNDNPVTGPGNMGGSSLLAMLVPGLMQMSKSRSWKIDDGYFSHGSTTQLTEDCAIKGSRPYEKITQKAGPCSTDGSTWKPPGMNSGINTTDGGVVCNGQNNQSEDPKSLLLPVQTTGNVQVPSVKDNTDQHANPLMNGNFTPYSHIERKLDTLLSKVEKVELYCSRFEDSMLNPLGSIEARLQRLEQQFDLFSVEIQSLRSSSSRMPAPDALMSKSQLRGHTHVTSTSASLTVRQPGLAVRAPEFSAEDSSGYNVTDENQVNFCGTNVLPKLLVKATDFISQTELAGEKLQDGSSPAVTPSSQTVRKSSPGLVVKVPEFPDDDDEVEEAEVGDHDDGHTQYDDTLSKSTDESSKSTDGSPKNKKPVSINGALASALEGLLTSTKGTSCTNSSACVANNLSTENTDDSLTRSLSPEKVDQMSTKDGLSDLSSAFGGAIDAAAHLSLSNATLDGKVEINDHKNHLSSDNVPLVASTESLGVPSEFQTVEESADDGNSVNGHNNGLNLDTIPFITITSPLDHPQPAAVSDSVDNGAQVNENGPALSLAEFLAAKNASSGKNGTSQVCCSNDCPEVLSSETASVEASKGSKNFSQLLVKKALEVDADDKKLISNLSTYSTSEGPSYAEPENAADGHNISTIETVSDKDFDPENTKNCIYLDGMDSVFCQHSATDSKKQWFENGSLDGSLNESFLNPNLEQSWSSFSGVESFNRSPTKEPAVPANTTSGKYVEDFLAGVGVSSTVTPIAGEELHNACDLLYEYKDDMLGTASTAKTTSKSSLSLEVLLGESSDSEAHISDLEDLGNGACFRSAQLLSSLSSSDDDYSRTGPLFDVADLPTHSDAYAAALNEPLVDVADLTNPSETFAPIVNEPLTDVFVLPNLSETFASALNESSASTDDLPEPQETSTGVRSGEHPDSLI